MTVSRSPLRGVDELGSGPYQPSSRSPRSASNAAKNAAKSKTGTAVTPGKPPRPKAAKPDTIS